MLAAVGRIGILRIAVLRRTVLGILVHAVGFICSVGLVRLVGFIGLVGLIHEYSPPLRV